MDGLEEIIGIVLLGLLSGLGSFFKAKGKKGADAKKAPAGTSPAGSSRTPAGTGRKERFPAGGGAEQEGPFRKDARSRKSRPGMGDGSRSGEEALRDIFPEKPAAPVARPLMQGKDGSRKKDRGGIVEEISLEPARFEPGNAFSPVREEERGKTLEDARPEAPGGREARPPFSLRDAVIAKTLLDRKYF